MTNVFLVYQFMVTATFYYPSFLVESLLDLTTKPNRKNGAYQRSFQKDGFEGLALLFPGEGSPNVIF
ncbi:hypothetical protein [Phaeodactylibacter xiamenensis]|nr:hypothetical protein [Phaeodactylibacter xiamenensis]